MKERLKELGWWLEDRLKGLCGEITPDKRLTVIVVMLLAFTILNLYFTITSIRDWGQEKEDREQIRIEHIRQLDLERDKLDGTAGDKDSIFYNKKMKIYE